MEEKFDPENVKPYVNSVSQNLESWKQIQKKIDCSFAKTSQAQFDKYGKELTQKNTYFTNTKKEDVNAKDLTLQKTAVGSRYNGTYDDMKAESYCQKCPSGKNHCPHKFQKEQIQEKYSYPIVSSANYGWYQPFDDLTDNHNLNSVTKSFYDNSHL